MADNADAPLITLARLAQEYQQKYLEMEDAFQKAQPEFRIRLLTARAEHTTERFRSAQHALLSHLAAAESKESGDSYKAAIALSRCFDEMRILLQFLLEAPGSSAE